MNALVFDFECYDPDLTTKGCGNVFGTLQIISLAYKIGDAAIEYTQDKDVMKSILERHNVWVAHNISYELSCASYLGIDFKDKEVYCTRIGSILEKNSRHSHSLDHLAKTVLKKNKDQSRFGRWMIESGTEIAGKKFEYPKEGQKTSNEARITQATRWCMQHLDEVNKYVPEIVEEYCKSDVAITAELHNRFLKLLDKNLYSKYSSINKVTVAMRNRGVKIDVEKLHQLDAKLKAMIEEDYARIYEYCPGLNIKSNKQLREFFEKENVRFCVNEDTGNGKFGKGFIENIDHPVAKIMTRLTQNLKYKNDFVDKFFDLKSDDDRIHGEMLVLGASNTGRFSHKNPNLANIPKRSNKELGKMFRSLFLAEDGEQWFSMDFSAQEPRMMVHFAALAQKHGVKFRREVWNKAKECFAMSDKVEVFDAKGIDNLVDAYKKNPALDSHTYNMDIINENTGVGISRDATKAIALGKAYAMGNKKLANGLKLSEDAARELSKAFDEGNPFISELDAYVKYMMITRGFIRTIGGKVLHTDGADYKAMNKLIQGSAADQTGFAILELYEKYGIVPTTVVHDEVNISGTVDDAKKVKHVMETIFKLEIPSLTEIEVGRSWGECEKLNKPEEV